MFNKCICILVITTMAFPLSSYIILFKIFRQHIGHFYRDKLYSSQPIHTCVCLV